MAEVNSSGLTAFNTSGDSPIVLITAGAYNGGYGWMLIINESGIIGSYSQDLGVNWHHMPASTAATPATTTLLVPHTGGNNGVMFKRIASGANVTGLWASLL